MENKRISFSGLKKWKDCPYKYKINYVDKISLFNGNEYTAFGTALHAACEVCVPQNEDNLCEIFEKSFEQEIEKLKNLKVNINLSLLEEMREQAKNICKYILPELHNNFKEFEIISVEEELMEEISQFESFGTSFKGFIDLVLKTSDGKYHIIDWKTCSWGWDSRRKSDPITNSQLIYYKTFFAKKHNIDPKNIETYFALLKRTAKSNNVEFFRVTSGVRKTENSLKVLRNAVINIENKNYIKNKLSCKYCEFYKTEYCN